MKSFPLVVVVSLLGVASARAQSFVGPLMVQNALKELAANPSAARVNLGLGTAAVANIGTAAGTVASGVDTRIVGALQTTGGTMTGALALGANELSGSHHAMLGNLLVTATSGPTTSWLYGVGAMSGLTPTGVTFAPISISMNDSGTVTGTGDIEYHIDSYNVTAGFSGNRNLLDSRMAIIGSPLTSDTSAHLYQNGTFFSRSNVNVGGTDDYWDSATGLIESINPNLDLTSGATHWLEISNEIDSTISTGSSVLRNDPLILVKTTASTGLGIDDDDGITFVQQGTGTAQFGYDCIVCVGDSFAVASVDNHTSVLQVQRKTIDNLGSSPVINNMVDARAVTYSGDNPFFLASPGFQTDGTGATTALSLDTPMITAHSAVLATVGFGTPPIAARYAGGLFDVFPTLGVSAPPAGGTTATATVGTMGLQVLENGTPTNTPVGVANGDVFTVVGGTGTAATITATVAGTTTYAVTTPGSYTALPTNPISVTGGSATTEPQFKALWTILTITNTGGSGYLPKPLPQVYATAPGGGFVYRKPDFLPTMTTTAIPVVVSALGVTGAATVGGNATVTGTLFGSAATLSSTLGVTGTVSFGSWDAHAVSPAVTSAGTNFATATPLTTPLNAVTTCSTGGVALPAAAPVGTAVKVFNRCGGTFNVYPDASGDTIEGGSPGAAVTLATTVTAVFTRMTSTNWLQN